MKMKRKLMRTGTSTTIAVPVEWLHEFKLKAGDKIQIEFENEKLILSP